MKQNSHAPHRSLTFRLALGGITAAAYVILTLFSNMFGLAFGSVQFRISEALCILPVFFPSSIAGLTLGCIISNFFSPINILDVVFGSAATLAAAILCRLWRNVRFRSVPILSPLPAVVINAVVVGLEIMIFTPGESGGLTAFLIIAAEVALGQFVCCYGGGILLFLCLKKLNFEKMVGDADNGRFWI